MKLYAFMEKNKEYDVYRSKGLNDYRFFIILQLFGYDFRSGELLAWLDDEKQPSTTTEWVSIRKKMRK